MHVTTIFLLVCSTDYPMIHHRWGHSLLGSSFIVSLPFPSSCHGILLYWDVTVFIITCYPMPDKFSILRPFPFIVLKLIIAWLTVLRFLYTNSKRHTNFIDRFSKYKSYQAHGTLQWTNRQRSLASRTLGLSWGDTSPNILHIWAFNIFCP
jgi:hypothetical protein